MAHFHEGCLQGRRGVSIWQSSLLLGRGGGSSNCLVVFAHEFPPTVPMAAVGADAGVTDFHMSADGGVSLGYTVSDHECLPAMYAEN